MAQTNQTQSDIALNIFTSNTTLPKPRGYYLNNLDYIHETN